MANILVIDDEECVRFTFAHFLREAGHQVACASTYSESISRISECALDLIFSDIILDGKTGLDVLRDRGGRKLSCPVVMITGYPTLETAADAVRLGAFDYIPKPVERETLLHVTSLALQYKKVTDQNEEYRSRLDAIFKSIDDAIMTVDPNWVLTHVNAAATQLCGFSRSALGKDLRSLNFGCAAKCLEVLQETIEKKQPCKAYRVESGQKINPTIVNVSTYPLIDGQGMFTGAVMVLRSETRRATPESEPSERRRLQNIVGRSRRMQKIFSLIEVLAAVETTVLIQGESGTGKELVAEALHELGTRRDKPLVKLNCSALSESLLETELFGHVKGAFTGAMSDTVGRFQKAHGGTIFLDEIGDLSPKVQATLLRVLQEKQFERVGDSTPIQVDVRVITATNVNLDEKVRVGQFRQDLLYRLRVVEIALPPLRERREDIPLLVDHFLKKFNRKFNKELEAVCVDVERILTDYPWPGNIRELEHALEHAFVICDQDAIAVDHLPVYITAVSQRHVSAIRTPDTARQSIIQALEKTGWNKKRAARLLNVDRKTIYRNIAKYQIPIPPEDDEEDVVIR